MGVYGFGEYVSPVDDRGGLLRSYDMGVGWEKEAYQVRMSRTHSLWSWYPFD